MKVAVTIARVLLGLIFVFFGLNGFIGFIPAPPMAGPAGAFLGAMEDFHQLYFISSGQGIRGLLLLTNQYVPLALVALAAVIANILVFHITMLPAALPLPILVTVLWFVVALPLRSHFAPLFAQKVRPD